MALKQHTLDALAVGSSTLCLLHCLALPLLLAVLPVALSMAASSEAFHLWLLVLAIPTSLVALFMGARQSGRLHALLGGGLGLLLLLLGFAFEETGLPGTVSTVFGSITLATSHLVNWRYGRSPHPHR